ncbi:MAG: hypothetical protein Q9167_005635 [Letrouitia subvulpina]
MACLRPSKGKEKADQLNSGTAAVSSQLSIITQHLVSALPDHVILPHHSAAFSQSMNSYWAKQECQVPPACVVRPGSTQQLCTALAIINREHDRRQHQQEGDVERNIEEDVIKEEEKDQGLFAVRSGGHSPVPGAASIKGGVLVDLGLLSEVRLSSDGSNVTIGAGAKWMDVSTVLDSRGLAVVGGRNSAVGVGGLTLGGGLSFFSPRFGLVCSNIISYQVVLAWGSTVTASSTENSDLWRALKGGSNNFGIVTSFTAPTFPCTKIWSGFLYLPSYQASKVLAAFHQSVNRRMSDGPEVEGSNYAAGPIACFSYVQKLGIQAIAVNLVYTSITSEQGKGKWPAYWRNSSFRSLWRLWSTCKVRSLTSATDEMNTLNPPGRRQVFATTTITNDPNTITAAHTAYINGFTSMRHVNVKGLVWTLVLQPLLPNWVRKGEPNPLGLQDGSNEPLVIVSFTINWDQSRDDELVNKAARRAIEQIEMAAAANKTGHRYRYLNYCASWQKPFKGYGEENWRFLQQVSRRYDPDGLFQKGCVGGFKLFTEGQPFSQI